MTAGSRQVRRRSPCADSTDDLLPLCPKGQSSRRMAKEVRRRSLLRGVCSGVPPGGAWRRRCRRCARRRSTASPPRQRPAAKCGKSRWCDPRTRPTCTPHRPTQAAVVLLCLREGREVLRLCKCNQRRRPTYGFSPSLGSPLF